MARHDEEPAFHVERKAQKLLASGLSPAGARTRALARFGSVPLADQCRDPGGIGFAEEAARDILYVLCEWHPARSQAADGVADLQLLRGLHLGTRGGLSRVKRTALGERPVALSRALLVESTAPARLGGAGGLGLAHVEVRILVAT